MVDKKHHHSDLYWASFIPLVGGLIIIHESNRLNHDRFKKLGWVVFGLSIVFSFGELLPIAWIAQIIVAILLRNESAHTEYSPIKVDINSCSKHELVRGLGIPIVYANDIELVRTEGYIFTYAEELNEIVGLPEEQIRRIEPQLIFTYDQQKEGLNSWRKVNFLSVRDMQEYNIPADIAQKIITERSNGDYKSAISIKERTGIPFNKYKSLL